MEGNAIAPRTFGSFVVGRGNRSAYDAARSVVQCSSKDRKPLVLCGGAGTGKTHLMQAIRNRFAIQRWGKAVYCSVESFTVAMVAAIRQNDIASFADSFPELDTLLIDDIQFLSGKERSQETFLHVSSKLIRGGKKIVAGGCRSTKEFADLARELSLNPDSWFAVEMAPPDYETMLAILQQKTKLFALTLPEDCRHYIAANAHDIRTIEGAVAMLTAYSALSNAPLCLHTVQRVLSHMSISRG